MRLPRVFSRSSDLAMDLGTVNTVVYMRGRGIVLNEPSVVAIETISGTQRVRAVGVEAKLMLGKTHSGIRTVRPIRDGVIADVDVAEQMMKHFIDKVHGGPGGFGRHPDVIVCIPSGATPVERRAVRQAARMAGGRNVLLIQESMAAAIGADLPVTEPIGAMVVDIGGGTTEVAILSLRGLAYSTSIRVGGDRMDEAIASAVRRKHNLTIGEATAEQVKVEIGSAKPPADGIGRRMRVRGRNLLNGIPAEIEVTEAEIAAGLADLVGQVVTAVLTALEKCEPELAADIHDRGIIMTGGGSLLSRLDEVLSDATGLAVSIADDALMCVALGAGRALEEAAYRGVATPF